nr:2-oxoglutarate and iron-dependent oxygenase domain-containing protein 3 isoform X2 [Parasteatoda tepidariorum]
MRDEGGQNFQIPWKRILTRVVLSALLIFVIYYSSDKGDPHVFAKQKESLVFKSIEVPCSKEYLEDISKFKGCAPKSCGRLVTDVVVTPEESAHLLRLCKKGLAFGGSSGGASILDLHSGALSHGNTFINIYEKLKTDKNNIFSSTDFKVYSNVRDKIQKAIAYNFGIQMNKLYLTHPTFFSEMTSKPAMTTHDEYWHVHIDKETYPSFHYTSLLYLNNYNEDFTGGRFVFVDKSANVTVEPKIGRVSGFTSGAENPHHVEQVKSGSRYAITVSFTCDPKQAIADPTAKKFSA